MLSAAGDDPLESVDASRRGLSIAKGLVAAPEVVDMEIENANED